MLLIDENLPYQLGPTLSETYVHASRIADQATDSQLWTVARENNWVVITKDTDFFDRLLLYGPPPRVIWVRLGNLRRKDLLQDLSKRWMQIQEAIQQHHLVQIFPHHLEIMDF